MKTRDDIKARINEKFVLDMIQGEEEYVHGGDYKEFQWFWVCFDTGERDSHGMVTLTMIKFTREEYLDMPEKFEYKMEQAADNAEHDEICQMFEGNFELIKEYIDDFINQYEAQGFDD